VPPEPQALRVHLGAHKTATTHFQKALHRHREALRAAGIDFVRPVELRAALAPEAGRLLLPWRTRARLGHVLAGLTTGAPTLAISEENLIGQIRDLFDARPYDDLDRRLAPLARLAGDRPLTLFLAIRPFDRLWASAHAEALRHHPHDPTRIDRLRRTARTSPPRWTDVVARLRRACPRATLHVWRYDDYEAHWRDIAAAFLGADVGRIPAVTRPRRSMSPSAEGVRLAEGAAGRRGEVAAIYAAHPAGSAEPFAPFDAVETAALRDAYAADLAALAAEPGTLLDFARCD